MLSNRVSKKSDSPNFLHSAWYKQHMNPFDAETNPGGIINLGTSENRLLEDIIYEKLSTIELEKMNKDYTHYCKLSGTDVFREKLASFFHKYANPQETLHKEDIFVMNGCGTVIESIGYSICDENDGVLIPAPYYCGFKSDLEQRIGVKVVPVYPAEKTFNVSVENLEDALLKAKCNGTTIKALLISNPNNPLGNVYTKSELMSFLQFCEAYDIHLICDEIYMLSVYDEKVDFTSILSLENISRYQDRVHVVWGFSKDFALSGFRCGVAITKNKNLQRALISVGYYTSVSTSTQYILEEMITDKQWLEHMISTNHQRLRTSRDFVCKRLSKLGVRYIFPSSGLFIWIDLSNCLENKSKCGEKTLFNKLMQNGLYLVPGFAFDCDKVGWFRVIISRDMDVLETAVKRLEKLVAQNHVVDILSKRSIMQRLNLKSQLIIRDS